VDVQALSPLTRDLLDEALPGGELVNELYRGGARVEDGFARERRCFALGERGWLSFVGWEGAPAMQADCRSRWALTREAVVALAAGGRA
jgi:hypothetical protein